MLRVEQQAADVKIILYCLRYRPNMSLSVVGQDCVSYAARSREEDRVNVMQRVAQHQDF